MENLVLALDWTPNANHIGFLVASEKGYYKDAGLDVTITSPADDNYAVTPAKKVESGKADFALCPMESVVSYRTKANSFPMKAIAAIFKEDVSAIAALKGKGISSPKDLDGKIYASYKARYEDEIVKQMIRNDGGTGDIEISYPEKLGIWNTLLKGNADATWIFLNWEGVEAENEGIELELFQMKDYNIPYSYSPVIAAGENFIEEKSEAYKSFLEATKKGFLDAAENISGAADNLGKHIAESDQRINLRQTIEVSAKHMHLNGNWGIMNPENVSEYVNWLNKFGLETNVSGQELFTNALL